MFTQPTSPSPSPTTPGNRARPLHLVAAALAIAGCSDGKTDPGVVEGTCQAMGEPEFLSRIGCTPDFEALASEPLDITLPGARSAKVVLDRADGDTLYFQNSLKYQIHYQFVSTHLSGNGKPVVPQLSEFNTTEYYSPDRRFLLGAVTHYEQPKVWALELAPYDTASAEMITTLYRKVRDQAFFGPALVLHPTSEAGAAEARKLPADVKVMTTDELYASIDYQPLTLGTAMGRLRFVRAAALETTFLSFQEIVVLDQAPNDISVVQGLITQEFQTPLSHINVLSANRRTPNMGLRKAFTHPTLRGFDGKLVKLVVTASEWTMSETTEAEAKAFWEQHKPVPVTLPKLNLAVTELVDIEKVTPEPAPGGSLREAIKTAVLAWGGKCAHYSVLARTKGVPIRKAFGVPVYYYDQFMRQNKFYDQLDSLLADSNFVTNAAVRSAKLTEMTDAMMAAPVDAELQAALKAKLLAEYPNLTMRFRTSTNSEDLDGFPCAGCYDSHTGDPAKWDSVLEAIKETWASTWKFRTFEERSYYGVDHKSVGMALLVAHNFPNSNEKANGVALTANPFDPSGLDPALYVNVQFGGDAEVVAPPPGVQSDQFLYYSGSPNQPITYIAHSNILPSGMTSVLSLTQIYSLGMALDAIHQRFSPAYGPAAGNKGWYAMDIEFKFGDEDAPGKPATLFIKQARPYPGRGN